MDKRFLSLLIISSVLFGACNNAPKRKPKTSSSVITSITSLSSEEITSSVTSVPVSSTYLPSTTVTKPISSATVSPSVTSQSPTSVSPSVTSQKPTTSSTSQSPDVDTYYASIKDSDSGTTLKDKLTTIINTGVTKIPYGNKAGETAYAMRICDRNWELSPDENDENPYMNLLYMVDNNSKPHRWSELEKSWNKEHIWAKSNGFPSEGQNAHADLHHLRASDYTNNNRRSNYCFNDLTSVSGTSRVQDANGDASGTLLSNTSYMPIARDRGDIARALFYMATRYAKSSYGTSVNLSLSFDNSNNNSGGWWGHLDVLLRWHEEDPVDAFETKRNNLIFERYQHNRNPFIDHPEYARRIWSK